jgi:ADP-ribose pyrophosphatase YjhB (NUDIX family)
VEREVGEETGLAIAVGQAFATVIEPRVRRVDVLFHVTVDERPEIHVAGEALTAEWLTADELGDIDDPTTDAFAELARYRSGGSHTGRVVGRV